jgi:anti-sigma B factor antagonist
MSSSHVARIDENDAVVLSPIGAFDIANVDILRSSVLDALAGSANVVIDLTKTTFLDSMGLGAIVGGARRAREAGGWLRLVNPQTNVRKALHVTQLDQVIGLYDTVDQAIAHVSIDDKPATS